MPHLYFLLSPVAVIFFLFLIIGNESGFVLGSLLGSMLDFVLLFSALVCGMLFIEYKKFIIYATIIGAIVVAVDVIFLINPRLEELLGRGHNLEFVDISLMFYALLILANAFNLIAVKRKWCLANLFEDLEKNDSL